MFGNLSTQFNASGWESWDYCRSDNENKCCAAAFQKWLITWKQALLFLSMLAVYLQGRQCWSDALSVCALWLWWSPDLSFSSTSRSKFHPVKYLIISHHLTHTRWFAFSCSATIRFPCVVFSETSIITRWLPWNLYTHSCSPQDELVVTLMLESLFEAGAISPNAD